MLTKKEITWITICIIILGFILGFSFSSPLDLKGFIYSAIIILTSVSTKNIASKFFSIDIEHNIWEFQRWGWYERSQFKKPLPIGLILPFVMTFLSLGIIKMMTLLQFNARPSKLRILKKRGTIRKSEINESDLAFTAFWGFGSLILLSIVSAILNQKELAEYSIYYLLWNLIPFGQLDGCKLFFGSLFNWFVILILSIISLLIILI